MRTIIADIEALEDLVAELHASDDATERAIAQRIEQAFGNVLSLARAISYRPARPAEVSDASW